MKRIGVFLMPLITLLQSCITVEIARDTGRLEVPESLSLSDTVRLTGTGTVLINGKVFLPASFRIDAYDTVIYIDPVCVDDPVPADLILLTHDHPDHFSISDIEKLMGPRTVVVAPKSVAAKLTTGEVRIVQPGDRVEIGKTVIDAVAAYNTRNVFLFMKAHPKSSGNVGFVIDLGDVRLYHAGDTDFIPEMEELRDIDVALVPIGGDNLTMNAEDAAAAVNAIQPKTVLPMHYDPGKSEMLRLFRSLIDDPTRTTIMCGGATPNGIGRLLPKETQR